MVCHINRMINSGLNCVVQDPDPYSGLTWNGPCGKKCMFAKCI